MQCCDLCHLYIPLLVEYAIHAIHAIHANYNICSLSQEFAGIGISQVRVFLQEFHPALEKAIPPVIMVIIGNSNQSNLSSWTHLLMVSESPHMHRWRLGRVMATNSSVLTPGIAGE